MHMDRDPKKAHTYRQSHINNHLRKHYQNTATTLNCNNCAKIDEKTKWKKHNPKVLYKQSENKKKPQKKHDKTSRANH